MNIVMVQIAVMAASYPIQERPNATSPARPTSGLCCQSQRDATRFAPTHSLPHHPDTRKAMGWSTAWDHISVVIGGRCGNCTLNPSANDDTCHISSVAQEDELLEHSMMTEETESNQSVFDKRLCKISVKEACSSL